MAERDKDPRRDVPPNPARRSFFQAAAGTAVAGAGLVAGGYVLKEVAKRPSNPEIARERPETRADIELRVNGKTHRLNVPHQRTLLLALREDLGLTGTKKGCNMAQCGACTVLAGDLPVYSCFMLAADSVGLEITTIENLEKNGTLHPLQKSFIEHLGSQCGHCTSGISSVPTFSTEPLVS
jgi:xanthine dehydrogenase YagT iron-sulfur-binding subunit